MQNIRKMDFTEQFVASVREKLACLRADGGPGCVSFPASLVSAERKYIHQHAKQLGLHSQSTGDGADRCIKVYLSADMLRDVHSEQIPSTMKREEKISRTLSSVLRHRAEKLHLSISDDGFVRIAEILRLPAFKRMGGTEEDVLTMVRNCEKQRFAWKYAAGEAWVRANQGHTISSVNDLALLKRVEEPQELRVCVHGTYFVHWEPILSKGLMDMGRNHIHLVAREPGQEVISGMRPDVQIAIYVDAARAMADGCEFFRSTNDVVLTRGFGGVLPAEYFVRAVVLAGIAGHEAGVELPLAGGKSLDVQSRERPMTDAVPHRRCPREAAAPSEGAPGVVGDSVHAVLPTGLAADVESSDEEVIMMFSAANGS